METWTDGEVVFQGEGRRLRDALLLLETQGIRSRVRRNQFGGAVIEVAARDAELARAQLLRFADEQRDWPPPPPPATPSRPWLHRTLGGVTGYVSILLLVRGLHVHEIGGIEWRERGLAAVAAIRTGELERCFTALTLHADGGHLANNVLFGILFGALLVQRWGAALPWLAGLFAGGLANFLAVWLKDPGARALGASTTVFALLGIGSAIWWRERRSGRRRWVERAAPLVLGGALLGILGAGDATTDALAHAMGYVVGLAMGLVGDGLVRRVEHRRSVQGLAAVLAIALLTAAWGIAVGR